MPHHYPAEVFWSDEDEGFIAVARDLPGCSAFGETRLEALDELEHAIAAWISAATAAGNPVPAPSLRQAEPTHSGKLLLRLPKTLHSKLARQAEEEEVSLNQYVVCLLAEHSSAHAVGKAVVQAVGQWVLQGAAGVVPAGRYAALGHDVRQVDVSLLRMSSYSVVDKEFAFAPIPLAAGE
jgi:predicted RNase H-like HicB family nuclease